MVFHGNGIDCMRHACGTGVQGFCMRGCAYKKLLVVYEHVVHNDDDDNGDGGGDVSSLNCLSLLFIGQITDQESLFTYGPGENVSTFANATFEPMFVEEIKWSDNETEAQAKAQCKGDVACLFDAASTNDVSIGVASREISIKVEKENNQLSKMFLSFSEGQTFFLCGDHAS